MRSVLLLAAAASATASSSTGESRNNLRRASDRFDHAARGGVAPGSLRARRLPGKKKTRKNGGTADPAAPPAPPDGDGESDGGSDAAASANHGGGGGSRPKRKDRKRKKGQKAPGAAAGEGGSPDEGESPGGRPAKGGGKKKKKAEKKPRPEKVKVGESPSGGEEHPTDEAEAEDAAPVPEEPAGEEPSREGAEEPTPGDGLRTSLPEGDGGWEPTPAPSAGGVALGVEDMEGPATAPPPSGQPAAGAPSTPAPTEAVDDSPGPTAAGTGHGSESGTESGPTTVTIDWVIAPYDDVTVRVGDRVEFEYSPYHNVYVHPTHDCDTDGRVPVSDEGDGRGTYDFVEAGTVTFACDAGGGGHCRAGQIVHFHVLPAGMDPEPTDSTDGAPAVDPLDPAGGALVSVLPAPAPAVAAMVPRHAPAPGLPPCPPRYDPARSDYAAGSAIEMDGHSFVCLDDLEAYCNMPERDPAWSEAEEDLWIVAWDHVGACSPATEATAGAADAPGSQIAVEDMTVDDITVEDMAVDDFIAVGDVDMAVDDLATGSQIAVDDFVAPGGITVEDMTVEDLATGSQITVDDFVAAGGPDVEDIAGVHTTEPPPQVAYQPTTRSPAAATTAEEAVQVLPDCPHPYDTGASYQANDEVEVDGGVYVCLGGEYEPYCGAPHKDEAWDELETALWNGAWQYVSSCGGPPEIAPSTAAPLLVVDDDNDDNDDDGGGGWGLSGGVIATLSPPGGVETDAAAMAAAAFTGPSGLDERLQGSPCVESYCSYELSDETVIKYQVFIPPGTSPEGGCDGCAVNVEVVHDRPGAWLGVGFLPDGGGAGGGDAVVGVPASGGAPASVARYAVRDDGGVDALPGPDQTLRNAALTTVYGRTVMTFTKLLRDDAGTVISPVWNNVWLFSYGDYGMAEGSSTPGTQEWTAFDITLL